MKIKKKMVFIAILIIALALIISLFVISRKPACAVSFSSGCAPCQHPEAPQLNGLCETSNKVK